MMGHPRPQFRAKADLPVGFPYRFNSSLLSDLVNFLFQNDCFFTRLSEIYSFIMILSVFYFTLFPFLYCHGILPKQNHTGKS